MGTRHSTLRAWDEKIVVQSEGERKVGSEVKAEGEGEGEIEGEAVI